MLSTFSLHHDCQSDIPFEVIAEMEGDSREWRNTQQNVVFVPRTAVNLSRGGCPEPTQNGCSRATVKKLDDVCLNGVKNLYTVGPGTPSYGAPTPSGSDNGQLFHTPVQENRGETDVIGSRERPGGDSEMPMDELEVMDYCDAEPMDESEAMDYCDAESMDESEAMDICDPEPTMDVDWHELVIEGAVTNNRSWRRRTNGYGATTADFIVYRLRSDDDDDDDDRTQATDESEAMDFCDLEPMDESEAMDISDPEPISSPESIDESESEPMDWTEIPGMHLISRFAALSLKCDLDDAIGDAYNCMVDETGNFVRRSPRLNGFVGSIWFPVSDARVAIQRRSARLQNQKDGVSLA